jgi:hypothetical protein
MKNIAGVASITLAAIMLAGCSSLTTGVSAHAPVSTFGAQGASYVFAHTDAQDQDADYARVEQRVRDALAARGLVEKPMAQAAYRVTVAYATQPAKVVVSTSTCGGPNQPCLSADGPAPFSLPFSGPLYRHTLALRFVAMDGGKLVYAVTSAVQDHHPEVLEAEPLLVDSALARVPFATGNWYVHAKRHDKQPPQVVSIEAIPPAAR